MIWEARDKPKRAAMIRRNLNGLEAARRGDTTDRYQMIVEAANRRQS